MSTIVMYSMDFVEHVLTLKQKLLRTEDVLNLAFLKGNRPLMKRCREILSELNDEIVELCGRDDNVRKAEHMLDLCKEIEKGWNK